MSEKYLVTSALPYANGPIHIGHLAGAYLPADIYVRFLKMNGDDVVYISGTDEHGVPITITAEKNGITPQEVVNTNHKIIKNAFAGMKINFDNFSATSREIHHKTAQEFFNQLNENDAFRVKEETGFYSPSMEMFLPDRYIEGTCPKCGKDGARGDQCESCGTMLTPEELVNPISKINGETPILKPTKHFYFKLGDFQERLEEFIASHPEWKDNVKNYCKSWFKEGLRDRAITRDLKWGIKLPFTEEEFISKVMYVWFEAPIGYISSTKEWAKNIGEPEKWKEYWQGDKAKLINFIGKDNIVFHSLVFPATIMAMNSSIKNDEEKYNLVTDIPANEFLNIENDKISTSRDWAVWVHEYLEDFPADLLRYYLTIIAPENSDSDFTWEGFQKHSNGELADIIGNFVNRLLTFTVKNFDSKIPKPADFTNDDLSAMEKVTSFFNDNYYPNLKARKSRRPLLDYIDVFRGLNKYFNDMEPWKVIKTDKDRCGTILYIGIKLLRDMAVMMYPYMPESAENIWNMIGEKGDINDERWGTFIGIEPISGTELSKPKGVLFSKIEDDVVEAQKAKLVKVKEEAEFEYEKEKEIINFEDFLKLDIRSGTIIAVEPVKKSNKLYKLQIDVGYETRIVMGGLKKAYKEEELLGKKVTILVNLKPRMIMGVESQGMLLAASDDNNLSLLDPGFDIGNGRTIG